MLNKHWPVWVMVLFILAIAPATMAQDNFEIYDEGEPDSLVMLPEGHPEYVNLDFNIGFVEVGEESSTLVITSSDEVCTSINLCTQTEISRRGTEFPINGPVTIGGMYLPLIPEEPGVYLLYDGYNPCIAEPQIWEELYGNSREGWNCFARFHSTAYGRRSLGYDYLMINYRTMPREGDEIPLASLSEGTLTITGQNVPFEDGLYWNWPVVQRIGSAEVGLLLTARMNENDEEQILIHYLLYNNTLYRLEQP